MGTQSEQNLVVLLAGLSKVIYRQADEAVLGMWLKEYMALSYLRDGGLSQQTLAGQLHMDENNLVLLLNALESREQISRRRDPDDRRRHIVEITARGRKALERAERGMAGLEDELLADLSAGERTSLKRLVLRILQSQASPRKPALVGSGARDTR